MKILIICGKNINQWDNDRERVDNTEIGFWSVNEWNKEKIFSCDFVSNFTRGRQSISNNIIIKLGGYSITLKTWGF